MIRFFSRIGVVTKGLGSFLAALFQRRDRVVEVSPSGFPILDGWEYSAEQRIVESYQARRQVVPAVLRTALFCYEGAQKGELVPLGREVETLGGGIQSSQVITPLVAQDSLFQVAVAGRPRLSAQPGYSFRLNGKEETHSELYDFDQVDLFGNRYVVLDISAGPEIQSAAEAK